MSQKQIEILKSVPQMGFVVSETHKLLRLKLTWLMSWGATAFTNFQDKALFFKVSGHHHKGIVLITLAWDDTYTITLLSSQWNVKKTITNVYFVELSETLDIEIERISDYVS